VERNLWNFLLPIFVGIWKAKPKGTTVSRLIRARCELRISCSVGISSDGVARCKHCAYGVRQLPRFHSSVRKDHPHCADLVFSLALISFLFAAIYKVLPDRDLEWGDVAVGAIVTGVLFTIGKTLISWYIGSSAVASSFGAAGALIVLLLWVYYSAQIFLLGAEFTKVYANSHGSKQGGPVSEHSPSRST
jgi:membrane protein